MDLKVENSIEIIREAIDSYDRITVACSFGKDSIVLVHLCIEIKPDIPIFTVMTPFKPKETLKLKDEVVKLWNLNITEYWAENEVTNGLWETDPDECCRILKVEPTKKALAEYDCWISGLRNTEGRTRVDYEVWEEKGNIMKVNPILEWTEAEIWKYTAVHRLPVHPWYGEGYRSIGCAPCSNPGGESERDGRWLGTSKCGGECGIHTAELK